MVINHLDKANEKTEKIEIIEEKTLVEQIQEVAALENRD